MGKSRTIIASIAILFAFCLLFVTAGVTLAQNLIVNPDFDSNVAGWNFTTPGTFTHDPLLDADSNPLSGSGRLDNTSPVAFGTSFAAQCVAVTGGSSYDFRAEIRIGSGQTQTGYAMVVVNFFDGVSCGGSYIDGVASPNVPSTTTDTWVRWQAFTYTAPVAAASAQVSLWVNKAEASGSLVVNFDNVAFGLAGFLPTPAQTPTRTPSHTPTLTATSTPTRTPTGTHTPTLTTTSTPTSTQTPTRTATATPTTTPTRTSTVTPTNTLLQAVTTTPTQSPTPTVTQTTTPMATPTSTPTQAATRTATATPTTTPTRTPTVTPTRTTTTIPTGAPTLTATPTITPTGTATVNVTPTPTDTPELSPCVGDCNDDGTVTVDEMLTMVNIALGNTPVTSCRAGDANMDGQITIDEILTAVNNALNGCE
jgi:hypothetical protein